MHCPMFCPMTAGSPSGRAALGGVPRLRRGVDPDRQPPQGWRDLRQHAGHGAGAGPTLHGVRGQRPRPGRRGGVDGSQRPGGGGRPRFRHLEPERGRDPARRCEWVLRRRRGHVPAARRGWLDPGCGGRAKRASVAMHYQLVDQDQRDRLATTAGAVFAEPDRRKVMPGKMVHKLHPKIDWGNADDLEIADRAPAPTSSSSPPGGGTAAVDSGPLTRAVRRPRGNRVRLRTRL